MSASPRPRPATTRPNGARPPNGRRSTVGSIAIIVFLFLAALGVLAAAASVMAYNALAGGLKPASSLTDYTLPRADVVPFVGVPLHEPAIEVMDEVRRAPV